MNKNLLDSYKIPIRYLVKVLEKESNSNMKCSYTHTHTQKIRCKCQLLRNVTELNAV